MPQLHDSSSRHAPESSAHVPQWIHDAYADDATPTIRTEVNSSARIFGIETEYGVSVTNADKRVDAGQVAMTMFAPIVARAHTTNTFLSNGARLYLDVGAHPEYASAEAVSVLDALANDLAGERIMRDLALDAQTLIRQRFGSTSRVHVFKNNVDSLGHAFGCHENYLVRRYVPLADIETVLLPFLITRQLFTGAGRMQDDGSFALTARAQFVDDAVSSATTRARPMINTRDEPHANPEYYRRLHVILGDSNRSQWQTLMKLATTHLVLTFMEHMAREREYEREHGLAHGLHPRLSACTEFAVRDPIAANRAVSADGIDAVVELADGRTVRALDVQRAYLSAVQDFALIYRSVLDGNDPHATNVQHAEYANYHRYAFAQHGVGSLDWVLAQWQHALDDLEQRNIAALATHVDWAAKMRLFDAVRERAHGQVAVRKLMQLDMDYHDIANGSVYESLIRHHAMSTLVDEATIERSKTHAPLHTRAVLRGQFVERATQVNARFACDWTELKLTNTQQRAVLLDPFNDQPTDDYVALMNALDALDAQLQ